MEYEGDLIEVVDLMVCFRKRRVEDRGQSWVMGWNMDYPWWALVGCFYGFFEGFLLEFSVGIWVRVCVCVWANFLGFVN